ncbi:MAG: hypothetical protein ACREQF_12570 [Candidatus Binataceae bacterium]
MGLTLLGMFFVVLAAASAGLLFLWPASPFAASTLDRTQLLLSASVIAPLLLLYACTGLGLIWRARWGYVLLTSILYLLCLAFPVGPVIGYFALSYMRQPRVRKQFGFRIATAPEMSRQDDRRLKLAVTVLASLSATVFLWMMVAF